MSDRFFLDTNVFIYSFDRTAPAKARKAEQLIRQAIKTQKGVVSFQVVQEFFNAALRRFQRPLKTREAELYLGTVFRPLLRVQSSIALYSEALRLQEKHMLSWYDSVILAAALQAECDVLFTEDLQHGQQFRNLQIVNPFL